MIFFHLILLQANVRSETGSIFMVGPGRQVEHAVGCYLAGSKCKPNSCQNVYYANRPKYFFLCVNR